MSVRKNKRGCCKTLINKGIAEEKISSAFFVHGVTIYIYTEYMDEIYGE